jgi:hypothetical protein
MPPQPMEENEESNDENKAKLKEKPDALRQKTEGRS